MQRDEVAQSLEALSTMADAAQSESQAMQAALLRFRPILMTTLAALFGAVPLMLATIDLVTLAGFKSAGVLCELTNDDGTMARAPECIEFAKKHNMAVVTIEDLVAYRQAHERKAS